MYCLIKFRSCKFWSGVIGCDDVRDLEGCNVRVHKCDSCVKEVPTCDGNVVKYGNGKGKDNVIDGYVDADAVKNRERIGLHNMFMEMCKVVEKRSSCLRNVVAAMVVRDRRIISIGYNGKPSGAQHCSVECAEGCFESIHAEANAISFAAKVGISTAGCSMYVTLSPCMNCAKLIIQAGITCVIYERDYREMAGIEFLRKNGVEVLKYELLSS